MSIKSVFYNDTLRNRFLNIFWRYFSPHFSLLKLAADSRAERLPLLSPVIFYFEETKKTEKKVSSYVRGILCIPVLFITRHFFTKRSAFLRMEEKIQKNVFNRNYRTDDEHEDFLVGGKIPNIFKPCQRKFENFFLKIKYFSRSQECFYN